MSYTRLQLSRCLAKGPLSKHKYVEGPCLKVNFTGWFLGLSVKNIKTIGTNSSHNTERNEEYLCTRETCPNVDIWCWARCDAAGVNPSISWSPWSDTLVLKPDTVLLTNLCKRLSQRINPAYCPESTFPNNTAIWSCSSGCMTRLRQPAEVVQGHSSVSSKCLL